LRSVIFAVLGTGLLVAAFGFIERFAWNGNILLFVAGYESGADAADTVARASGPFINPDHFANYHSLIFPLALGCALFRTFMVPKANEYGLKIFCAFTTFLLFTGILLSLSRGGWINALFAVVVLVWLAPWGRERQSAKRKGPSGRTVRSEVSGVRSNAKNSTNAERNNAKSRLARFARLSTVTVCVLLIVSLFFAGQSGREQVDVRLSDTIEQTDLGLGARVTVILKDIPKMIMDFPLFGVGLGAWPELFLHYRSGPWSRIFFREAHNDYLEVLAETGFIGAGLLAGFFFVAGKRLVRGLRKSSSKYLPLIAAILAALGGMAVHEWLDFSLQIPANAFLFTILLALGLRIAKGEGRRAKGMEEGAGSSDSLEQNLIPNTQYLRPEISLEQGAWSREGDQRSQVGDVRSEALGVRRRDARNPMNAINAISARMTPYAGLLAAAVLLLCALLQDQSTYPYNLREMTSLAEAQELLLRHPTHSPYHLSVVRLAGEKAALEWQLLEAKAALWNEPVNPSYRDFYAATLMAMDRTEDGLKEVTRSVAESPSLGTHAYLAPENLPLLSDEEQAAVEQGFRQALSRSYPEALAALAEFYAKLERFADQAALYEQAAAKETDTARKSELLINAALGYVKVGSGEQGVGSELGATPHGTHAVADNATNASEDARSEGLGVRRSPENATNATNATNAINAKNATNAERLFRAAIAVNPADPKPYHHLLTAVFATRKDLDGAKELVAEGLKVGAPALPLYLSLAEAANRAGDQHEREAALESAKAEVDKLIKSGESPHTLYIALADGARRAGDRERESAALLKALDRQPRAPETLLRLANVYLEKRNYDRAAMYLNRVSGITPDSADLFYRIAQAEEARYRFPAAGRAYARALELAPENEGYRQRYEAFRERVERNREVNASNTR
jgi:O-antigen ligase/thioredoxin-like negative regulator of GroEL